MTWKSATFKKAGASGQSSAKEAISRAVDKHRDAMSGVVGEAKKLADERRHTLDRIKDPQLKRSAAR